MNNVILMGRLTRDPEIRHTQDHTMVASYSLAVDRYGKDADRKCDFIDCTAWGKAAEFADKWLQKGIKILVRGRLQTGSYENKDGQRVRFAEVVVDSQEFCEKKRSSEPQEAPDEFVEIPDDFFDEELPF